GQEPVTDTQAEPQNAEAYLDRMLRLLRNDGVRFPNNKVVQFTRLEQCNGEWIHADGEWQPENGILRQAQDATAGQGQDANAGQAQADITRQAQDAIAVAVSFGPEFGPVTAYQVENALRSAYQRGFDALVFAGFSFDAAAQAVIQEDPNPRVRCHMAHIRPDVNMGDLLKETPTSQIFTVFGSPRMALRQAQGDTAGDDGMFEVEMQGVDIYDPVENNIRASGADKVAAWFLDTDYDGHTFCITQAFFPDKSAWSKLARALKGVVDEGRFDMLSGTVSLPFPAGEHKRVAMKVIDPRGNEVMCVRRLAKPDEEASYGER
ncbi:MAG: hypothetical protein HYX78_06595, partial [Armatimonadetes bacterium]|nr:hypothetical protein [Armatimonadota bacterium]